MLLSFFQLSLAIRNVWPQRMSLKRFIELYLLLLLAGMPVTFLSCVPYGLFGILVAVCIIIRGLVCVRESSQSASFRQQPHSPKWTATNLANSSISMLPSFTIDA